MKLLFLFQKAEFEVIPKKENDDQDVEESSGTVHVCSSTCTV